MKTVKLFLKMIQFQHTILALPFVLAGAWLAMQGFPGFSIVFCIVMAAVFARTAGMCVNRLADLEIDRHNPRTSGRPLVSGEIPLWVPKVVAVICFLMFVLTAFMLNHLSFILSPLVIAVIILYSFLKRWTVLCHFGIGLVISCAPLGGWVAVRNSIGGQGLCLSAAVLFWAAGFDILYSMQDAEFDRSAGLHSIPAKFGHHTALNVAAGCHAMTVVFLCLLGILYPMKQIYNAGWFAAVIILFAEHLLIRKDFNRFVNFSFFTLNGILSLLYMVIICVSV